MGLSQTAINKVSSNEILKIKMKNGKRKLAKFLISRIQALAWIRVKLLSSLLPGWGLVTRILRGLSGSGVSKW